MEEKREYGKNCKTERDMGISIHWCCSGNSGTIRDQGVYRPSPEHIYTIHYNSYYNLLVFISIVEAGDADLPEMVGSARSIYPRGKSGACGSEYRGKKQG